MTAVALATLGGAAAYAGESGTNEQRQKLKALWAEARGEVKSPQVSLGSEDERVTFPKATGGSFDGKSGASKAERNLRSSQPKPNG
jgi:hypothetical protein